VDSNADAVEVVDAPTTAAEVQHFLPRLTRALAGGAPIAVAGTGSARQQVTDTVRRAKVRLPWDAALVVPTSGSTGTPRLAVLSRAALLTSADMTHGALGGAGRWLLALPTTHIAGLQVLVRSLRAGLAPAVLDTRETFTAAQFAAAVDALDVSATEHAHYTSLVPTQLQRLLDDGAGVEALWKLDAVLVGGAMVAPALLERARNAGVTVVRTYGMVETCGGCVYDGVPLDGVQVRIGDDGRVHLRGSMLFEGYLGGEAASVDDGWFVTSDLGHLEDGVLFVDGRVDNVINSGGVKVPAESVERSIAELTDIADVVVVGVPDTEWGERVVAVVAAASYVNVDDLRSALRGAVPNAWLPREVVRMRALPLLSSGKHDRAAVRATAADLER
jgi:O-succinylbenzoic acid--CoA ligase